MLNCAKPEIFPLRSGSHLWLSVNGGITIWTQVFSVCWGQWPPRSQSTYQSIYQIILLCEKVGYKPVLSIFGITNYEHLDMHIYLLWGCTEMHKKDCKAYSTLLPWWGRGALWEEIVLWRMKCSYSIWGPPTSCPQRAYITFRIRKNNK